LNRYGKGIDEIVERGAYGADNAWHWLFPQQYSNGNVTHLTNASGVIVEQYKYDAFGAVMIYDGTGNQLNYSGFNNRFYFTGREYAAWNAVGYNAGFKFYEYRARAYNPTLGRFMSEDPKGFDAGDYNLFRYCHNDPLDLTDPMGLADEAVNAKMVQTGVVVSLAMHAQTVLPIGSNIPVLAVQLRNAQWVDYRAAGGVNLGGSVQANFYVREGQMTLVNRSRGEGLVVRMESGKGAATNVPEAEALKSKGPLPMGSYRVLSRTQDGSQVYKRTGFNGYILAPLDSTPFNDRYDAFRRGSFRMHYGPGVGCLTTCIPRDFARVQSFLERSSTVSQESVTGWGTQQFYGILNVYTSIHD
jgi:RHS repeat-associated protein